MNLVDVNFQWKGYDRVTQRKAIFLLTEHGVNQNAVTVFLDCSHSTVYRCICRNIETGNFNDRKRTGRPSIIEEDTKLRCIAFYCQSRPLPNCGRWTLRWAESHLKAFPNQIGATPGKSTIHRILQDNKLKPHLSGYFLHITDPDFFPKMEHLLSLYKRPPRHLFFFDECPGIQVLKRLTPDLQTEKMMKRLEEFEYIRNGTMDVFAFLNNADGKIFAECRKDHKTGTFLDIFEKHVGKQPKNEQLHYVMDNLSSHCSYSFCQTVAKISAIICPSEKDLKDRTKRTEWLQADDKRIVIHFTPFHGSWLNLVEIWFGIMGKKVLCESFESPDALITAFEAFVIQWNSFLAHPFNWTYNGDGLHDRAVKRFIDMLGNSSMQMDTRILTKMLSLMTNLLTDYFSLINEETWQRLSNRVSEKYDQIQEMIKKEPGSIKKKKLEIAVANFVNALFGKLGHDIQVAA